MHDDIYMLWLSSILPQLGSRKLNTLLEAFGTARHIFNATKAELQDAVKLTSHAINILTKNRTLGYIESLLTDMESLEMVYLARCNDRFPSLLKEIPDPPVGIFFIGTLPADNTNKIAIIGSRKCSEYGLMTARTIAQPLAKDGIVIVSGMARGVDSMAHRGALQGGGQTIAVLGCGVDICYPSENKTLRADIIKNGCVLSEYPPGTRPAPAFFPARNRIISGLCQGVIVTEATKRSGTLITVQQAIEQGREVFSVPGNISSKLSQGTNELIRDGAYPIADHTDVLQVLGITPIATTKNNEKDKHQRKSLQNLAPDENQVYDSLTFEATSFDMLIETTGISPGKLHLICMNLELKGLARKLSGNRYVRGL